MIMCLSLFFLSIMIFLLSNNFYENNQIKVYECFQTFGFILLISALVKLFFVFMEVVS